MRTKANESWGDNGSFEWRRLRDLGRSDTYDQAELLIWALKVVGACAAGFLLLLLGYLFGVEAGR